LRRGLEKRPQDQDVQYLGRACRLPARAGGEVQVANRAPWLVGIILNRKYYDIASFPPRGFLTSHSICLLGKPVGEVVRDFEGFIRFQPPRRDQRCEICAIHPPRDIVARRD